MHKIWSIMKKHWKILSTLAALGIAVAFAAGISSAPTALTLRHQTDQKVAYTVWKLPDGTIKTVHLSPSDYKLFQQEKYSTITPDPSAVPLIGWDTPALDTTDGYPHPGDAYERYDSDLEKKVLVITASDDVDFGFHTAKASDPGAGQTSRLTGFDVKSAGNQILIQDYDLGNLPAVPTTTPTKEVTVIDQTVPNHHSVTFDNTTSAEVAAATTLTISSFAMSASANGYMLAMVNWKDDGQTLTSVVWNGTDTLTSRVTAFTSPGPKRLGATLDFVAPTTGTHSLVTTMSSNVNFTTGVMTATGVDQTTPRAHTGTNTGTYPDGGTITISSAVGNLVWSGMFTRGTTGGGGTDATWTSTWDSSADPNSSSVGARIAGAASVTRTDAVFGGDGNDWAMMAIDIGAAAAGAGTASTTRFSVPNGRISIPNGRTSLQGK